jgi:ABC-type nitrate/sulfonate/bicarbonate transport system substrate-binding protein
MLAATVAIAASARSAAAEETVRLASLKVLAILPVIDAQQMGYFSKEGLKVEMITLNNGPAVVSAVVGGSADIGFAATLPVISAVAGHQPIREFMVEYVERWPLEEGIGEYLVASARSGIQALEDLKGKTAASNATNGGCDLMIRDHIRAAGIPASAVKMVVIPFPQMQAALELGTVDAVCTLDPFYSAIMASPQIKPTVLAKGIIADLPQIKSFAVAGYFARPDWLTKNKTAVASFMRAMVAAEKDLAAHMNKYHQMIVSEFKMSAELADKVGFAPNTGSVVAEPEQFEIPIAAMVRTGLLKEPIAAADVGFTIQP